MTKKNKKQPVVHIIAGPNGSGKTTFANEFLPHFADCKEFVNADLLAKGISPFAPEEIALKAGRLMLSRINELALKKSDFAFETTLAGRTHLNLIRAMKKKGYRVNMFFLWLPSAEIAIARVAERVEKGGHNIPENVIHRRFKVGIKNLFNLYLPVLDTWTLFDSSVRIPKTIAQGKGKDLKIVDELLYNKIKASLK